jgi:hypothetical protein
MGCNEVSIAACANFEATETVATLPFDFQLKALSILM